MGDPAQGEDAILARLDRISQILQIALAPQLDAGRDHLRADALTAAIFDQTAGKWVASGDLQRDLAKASGAAERTVRRRLVELTERRFIEHQGEGNSRRYRSAGLV